MENFVKKAFDDSLPDNEELLAFFIQQAELTDLFTVFKKSKKSPELLYVNVVKKPENDNLGELIEKTRIFQMPVYLAFHNDSLEGEEINKVPNAIEVPLPKRLKSVSYLAVAVIYHDANSNVILLKKIGSNYVRFEKEKLTLITENEFLETAHKNWIYIIYKKDIIITKTSNSFTLVPNTDKTTNMVKSKKKLNYLFYVSVPKGKIKEDQSQDEKPLPLCRKMNALINATSSLIKHQSFDQQDLIIQNINLIKERISNEPHTYTDDMQQLEDALTEFFEENNEEDITQENIYNFLNSAGLCTFSYEELKSSTEKGDEPKAPADTSDSDTEIEEEEMEFLEEEDGNEGYDNREAAKKGYNPKTLPEFLSGFDWKSFSEKYSIHLLAKQLRELKSTSDENSTEDAEDDEEEEDEDEIYFVDEASIQISKSRKISMGFAGIDMAYHTPMKKRNISILTCVIPGVGVAMLLVKGSINAQKYFKFLKQVDSDIRKFVCNNKTHIIYINDNATIHKESKKEPKFLHQKLDILYTVAYSPHLNAGVENFFSFIKEKLEDVNPETFLNLNDIQLLDKMCEKLLDILKESDIAEKTRGWYANSIAQWRRCAQGFPLTTYKIPVSLDDDLLNIQFKTYRA